MIQKRQPGNWQPFIQPSAYPEHPENPDEPGLEPPEQSEFQMRKYQQRSRKSEAMPKMGGKDKKVQQLVLDMITQDGVLNLQAKSLCQQQPAEYTQEQNEKSINYHTIFCSQMLRNPRFTSIVRLNLSSNKIVSIDGDFCKNLPNVQLLDLRANQIREISTHIKAMVSIKVLKLDKNELTRLPEELYDIRIIEELTFQQNRVDYLSPKIGQLIELKKLNMASNMIPKIPEEIGRCEELQTLCVQNNRFASFPCSFLRLTNLKELSLEWFIYAKPPKPQYITRSTREGTQIFESLMVLCNLLQKYKMNECALITFLENYSDDNFDKNQRDNRQRTPLHKAAVMGDTGVIEGLLMDKADTNLLDKDSCTPLCLAIRQENYEAAQTLIDGGADVNLGGGIFGSPVHLAIVRLQISIIQSLIDKRADLNKQDSDGNTPLHLVMNIFSKNPERCCHILELLAMNGANVDQKNNDQWAAIHTAVRKGQEKGVNAIIKLNKKLHQINLGGFNLNVSGGVQLWSSLHLAAHASQLQIISDLSRAGADIFQRAQTNQLPRHCARGNYIMTKNIKLLEEIQITKEFEIFELIEAELMTLTANAEIPMKDDKDDGKYRIQKLKDSKMQPISPEDRESQKKLDQSLVSKPSSDLELDNNFSNFALQYGFLIKQHKNNTSDQNRQPTRQNRLTPISKASRRSLDSRALAERHQQYSKNHQSMGKGAFDADVADTLRENMSDEQRSLDEEYDVIDEEEPKISRHMATNSLHGPAPALKRQVRDSIGAGNAALNDTVQQREAVFGEKRAEPTRPGLIESRQGKINMFYLKDILVRNKDYTNNDSNALQTSAHGQTQGLQEKLNALSLMKKHSHLVAFQHAMRALIISKDFSKIPEKLIQVEIMTAISNSIHYQLAGCLRQFLRDEKGGGMLEFQEDLALSQVDEDMVDAIRDAISQLELSQKAYERNPGAFKPWKVKLASGHSQHLSSGPIAGHVFGNSVHYPNNYFERNANVQKIQFEKYQGAALGDGSGPRNVNTGFDMASSGYGRQNFDQNIQERMDHNEGSEYSRASYTSGALKPVPIVNSAVGGFGMQKAALYKGPKRFGGLVQPRHILDSHHVQPGDGVSGPGRNRLITATADPSQQASRHRRSELNHFSEGPFLASLNSLDQREQDQDGNVAFAGANQADAIQSDVNDRADFDNQNTLSAKFENLPRNVAQGSLKSRVQGTVFADVTASANVRRSGSRPLRHSMPGQRVANTGSLTDAAIQEGDGGFDQDDQFYNALRQLNRVNQQAAPEDSNPGRGMGRIHQAAQIHDKVPSSPQSINIFESKVARSIQQNHQRQQLHLPARPLGQDPQGHLHAFMAIKNIEEDPAEEEFDEEWSRNVADRNLDSNGRRMIEPNMNSGGPYSHHSQQARMPREALFEEEKDINDQIESEENKAKTNSRKASPRGPPRSSAGFQRGEIVYEAQGRSLLSDDNMSTVKKKETLIIQKQIIINTQKGLNPISPQSSNFDEAQPIPVQEPAPVSKRQEQLGEDLERVANKSRSGVDPPTSKATKTSKALVKRGSKPSQVVKDPNHQPNGIFRHSNSVSSLKSVKSLRSINSLKSGPAVAGGVTNSVSKKGRKEGSSNKQKIQSNKSKTASATVKQGAKPGTSNQQSKEQPRK